MKHINEVRILYSDTDAYGVVWHGAYIRWLEAGRVELSEMLGIKLEELENNGITFPVVEMNLRYKSPAVMNERILIETSIKELKQTSVSFEHIIKDKNTEKIHVIASTTIVAIDKAGKLFRKLPDFIYSAYKSALVSNTKLTV